MKQMEVDYQNTELFILESLFRNVCSVHVPAASQLPPLAGGGSVAVVEV